MFTTTQAMELFTNMTQDVSAILVSSLLVFLGILAALLGLSFGINHVATWIYDGGLGDNMRYFGKSPWKGYKRFHSYKWNVEHTAL